MPSLPSAHASLLALALLCTAATGASAADLLTSGPAHELKGTKGRFDFISIDPERDRLLAAHTGNNSLDVIDLKTGELIKAVATGAAQDGVADAKHHRYLASVSKPPQLAIIDAETLEVTGTVKLEGPADLLAVQPSTGLAYVDHDDGSELWVVDPDAKKVTASVHFASEAPEDLAFDATGQRLFQAMKTAGNISVVEVASHHVTATWPTAPAKEPHGIALVPAQNAIAIAGGNAKLVLMSQADGQILASAEGAERVDQIAYDPELNRLYCPSALGKMLIFTIKEHQLETLGEVATTAGARSIAIDPKTHTVWLAYVKGETAFVQPFTVSH